MSPCIRKCIVSFHRALLMCLFYLLVYQPPLQADSTIPVPMLDGTPATTSDTTAIVTGTTLPGEFVNVYVNDVLQVETTSDGEGKFIASITIHPTDYNLIYVRGYRDGEESEIGMYAGIQQPRSWDSIAPDAPDTSLITATMAAEGLYTLTGAPGAVEAGASLEITNIDTGGKSAAQAGDDGSFVSDVTAEAGHILSLQVFDWATNASPATPFGVGVSVNLNLNQVDGEDIAAGAGTPENPILVQQEEISVKGRMDGPIGTSVSTGGFPVCTQGNTFYARIPVDPVTTKLKFRIGTPDGLGAERTLSIERGGLSAMGVSASPTCGFSPLMVDYSIINRDENRHIEDVYLQFGDGSSKSGIGNRFRHTFKTPGVYESQVIVKDDTGTEYTTRHFVVVDDALDTQAILHQTYNTLIARLQSGSIEGALNLTSLNTRNIYRKAFTELADDLPTITTRAGEIKDCAIGFEHAECIVHRNNPDTEDQIFFIQYLRGNDGVWRIENM